VVEDGVGGNGLVTGERFAVYLQNQSVNDLVITEALLAGAPYVYVAAAPAAAPVGDFLSAGTDNPQPGEFFIITNGNPGGVLAEVKVVATATLEPGEDVTLLFGIDDNIPIGRDAQLKLTTANGNVFVTTLIAGSQSG